jgi:putative NADPH-quinone reductase
VKVHVVYCHPLETSFAAAARDRVVAGLATGGHEVRLLDLYADGFRPEMSAWENEHHLDASTNKPEILRYAADLQWCDVLVLVYPTWFSGQPAMLKGWFDRIWVRDIAYELPEGTNTIKPALHNVRKIMVVTTHGSPKWVNAIQGEGGKRTAFRAVRLVCNPRTRTKWLALYGIDTATTTRRTWFLRRVERTMARLR